MFIKGRRLFFLKIYLYLPPLLFFLVLLPFLGREHAKLAHARADFKDDLLGGENESDNETVETQHLGENEDQDHSDEQPRLLSRPSYT